MPEPLRIGGRRVDGRGAASPVLNPATGEEVGAVVEAADAEADAAVDAAAAAFPDWAATPASARAGLLQKVPIVVAERRDDIARALTMEQGKPLNEARGEIDKFAAMFAYYAGEAGRVRGDIIDNGDGRHESFVYREPVGVVVAISPWNYPVELVGWKVAAGLAAGCTFVVKPPSLAPLSPLAALDCLDAAGFPPGVVNAVTGGGATVGRRLVQNPKVARVAFTGSLRTGRDILTSCPDVKKITLELGGNCPLIVSASADLDLAARGAIRRAFRNAGQICIAINRIYAQRAVYDEFLERLEKAARALVVDDGARNPKADMGPVSSAEILKKTERHLADALDKGARLVCGGGRLKGAQFARGFFFEPTIVSDAPPDALVMTDETFGPLVGVAPFEEWNEAIARANDSPYGLAAYVYTRDLAESRRAARDLDFGNVAINNPDAGAFNAPYGGRKQSGVGYEHGREGMEEYMQMKHVRVRLEDRP